MSHRSLKNRRLKNRMCVYNRVQNKLDVEFVAFRSQSKKIRQRKSSVSWQYFAYNFAVNVTLLITDLRKFFLFRGRCFF